MFPESKIQTTMEFEKLIHNGFVYEPFIDQSGSSKIEYDSYTRRNFFWRVWRVVSGTVTSKINPSKTYPVYSYIGLRYYIEWADKKRNGECYIYQDENDDHFHELETHPREPEWTERFVIKGSVRDIAWSLGHASDTPIVDSDVSDKSFWPKDWRIDGMYSLGKISIE